MTTASHSRNPSTPSPKMDSSRRKACDLCHQKKVRCNGNRPRCSNCVLYNVHCSFETVESNLGHPIVSTGNNEDRDRLARMEGLITKVLEKVNELESRKTESTSNPDSSKSFLDLDDEAVFEISSSIKAPQTRHQTPQPNLREALALVTEYFRDFNSFLPLFDEPSFLQMVRHLYAVPSSQRDAIAQAALDIVLSLAHRIRAMQIDISGAEATKLIEEEDRMASDHLNASQSALSELTLQQPSLLCVQVLLGIVIAFLGTPNHRAATVLIPTAIRLAHDIRLHALDNPVFHVRGKLTVTSTHQEKRVFWIAYILDMQICLENDKPPAQNDSDFDVALPDEAPFDDMGVIYNTDRTQALNYFRQRAKLALIHGKIYRQVHSIAATKQSDAYRFRAVGELQGELNAWKEELPADFRLENVPQELKLSKPALMHIAMLHSAYLNAQTRLDHLNSHDIAWVESVSIALEDSRAADSPSTDLLLPRSWSSCVLTSREFLQLFSGLPQGNFFGIWWIVCSLATAILIILVNAIGRSSRSTARSDLNGILAGLSLMGKLADQAGHDMLKRMSQYCQTLQKQAMGALYRLDSELPITTDGTSSSRKRKPVEDQFSAELKDRHIDRRHAQQGGETEGDLVWPENIHSLTLDLQRENQGPSTGVDQFSAEESLQFEHNDEEWEKDRDAWGW